MPDSDSATYVRHIARSAGLIEQFMAGKSQDDYVADVLTQSAVERQLTIVGEALTQLARRDQVLAARISEYRKIIGLRNILVHGYVQVDPYLVWDTLRSDLAQLRAEVAALLTEE